MAIQDKHDRINFLMDREQGQYFTPEEIDLALDMAQMRELRKYFGDDAAVQQGNANILYKQMQYIEDAITPFLQEQTTTVVGLVETIPIPAGTQYITGLTYTPTPVGGTGYLGDVIEILPYNEYRAKISSSIFTFHSPIARVKSSTEIEVYANASESQDITLQVIRRPTKPDLGNTIDLEWSDAKCEDIIYSAIQILGKNAADVSAMEFGASKQTPKT